VSQAELGDGGTRVLMLTADYPPNPWSGIGVAVERQARALAELGARVQVLVAAAPGRPLAAPAEAGRLSVHPLSRRRFPVDPRGADVVHVHSLALADLALEVRRRAGAPLVYTAHSLVEDELRFGRVDGSLTRSWRAVQARLFAEADRVVFLSRAEHAAALARYPELEERSGVVANGVPDPDPEPEAPRPEPAMGPVVFAGRFARTKGMELLGDAVARVLARRPARFVVAGGHGDGVGEWVARDLRRSHRGACAVTGWLSRAAVDGLFARAAVVLVPSLYEPFGLVALEAMRAGAPVLAADVGGLRDVVTPDSGGRLVRSRDPERWADEVCALLASPDARRHLRERGPRHVRAHFGARRSAERLLQDVYQPVTQMEVR